VITDSINGNGKIKMHRYHRLLVVIKQTAFEEYSQLKLRGQAPKALRWKRLENRYKSHKKCVNELLGVLRHHKVDFTCVNRAELDRQHLVGVDLIVSVGGDGTLLSAAHFLDHGSIPMLGINSDPISQEELSIGSVKKKLDERRSHGALCMCTADTMHKDLPKVLNGSARISHRTRIQCIIKSTFSETRLVPALNDILIANPCAASVSRFRMGWLQVSDDNSHSHSQKKVGTVTRFAGTPFDVVNSINVWSSGLWVCTGTGSTAAVKSAGGQKQNTESNELQYLIREHMIDNQLEQEIKGLNNGFLKSDEQLFLRWNSRKGKIYADGSHMHHNLELGDEILISNEAQPLQLFMPNDG